MQKGTCKRVKGKKGIVVCRLANGKVRFKKASASMAGLGKAKSKATGARHCTRKGRNKDGKVVCRAYSSGARRKSSSRRRAR